MALIHGPKDIFLLVDGFDLTASQIKALRAKDLNPVEDSTGVGNEFDQTAPLGVAGAELEQEGGYFESAAGAAHAALKTLPSSAQAAARVANWGWEAGAIGATCFGAEGLYSHEYDFKGDIGQLSVASPTYAISGEKERCVILQPLAAQTITWDTEASGVDYAAQKTNLVVPISSSSVANPSVIDTANPHHFTNGQLVLIAGHSGSTPAIDGEHVATVITPTTFSIPVNVTVGGTGGTVVQANSVAGAVGFLQVTAFSGWTGIVVKVLDSTDDITYVQLIAFTNVTAAPGKQRATVAGTVDRYLAMEGTYSGGGPGSATVFCACKRNE